MLWEEEGKECGNDEEVMRTNYSCGEKYSFDYSCNYFTSVYYQFLISYVLTILRFNELFKKCFIKSCQKPPEHCSQNLLFRRNSV